jgi:ABC-type antimicrobial peptide transport system permease subunit
MTSREIIKFILKIIITLYFCAVFAFIFVFFGSRNFLLDAFSPVKLFNEIMVGNFLFIMITILGTVFILRFNYLRKKKVDYEDGGRAWPWR